jgi:hypothetical protein
MRKTNLVLYIKNYLVLIYEVAQSHPIDSFFVKLSWFLYSIACGSSKICAESCHVFPR